MDMQCSITSIKLGIFKVQKVQHNLLGNILFNAHQVSCYACQIERKYLFVSSEHNYKKTYLNVVVKSNLGKHVTTVFADKITQNDIDCTHIHKHKVVMQKRFLNQHSALTISSKAQLGVMM